MVISILGCGWYGMALAGELVEQGIAVKGSTTSEQKLTKFADVGVQPYLVQISAESESFDPQFFECDVLFISIPPRFRKGETAGYTSKLQRIIQAIQQYQISKVIYISSTGVYGDHNSVADELTDTAPETESGFVLLEAEQILQQQTSFKTTILRFGGLVGPGRHPGRFFAGKKDIPNGRAPVNLIHLDDCIGISISILKQNAFGFVFNACSPDHPAKADFYCHAALQAGLPVPEFLDELDRWKVVNSINLSAILHYEFKVDSWLNCSF
ncbi:MAG: Nucleoside-diphosphate-sugar epimerase [Mucilaginibacter sp.]|nr:Nucleoside-diphosphate-sugar epimerase [Mucilaginibacter sp.]